MRYKWKNNNVKRARKRRLHATEVGHLILQVASSTRQHEWWIRTEAGMACLCLGWGGGFWGLGSPQTRPGFCHRSHRRPSHGSCWCTHWRSWHCHRLSHRGDKRETTATVNWLINQLSAIYIIANCFGKWYRWCLLTTSWLWTKYTCCMFDVYTKQGILGKKKLLAVRGTLIVLHHYLTS